jgi:hypothetical protein
MIGFIILDYHFKHAEHPDAVFFSMYIIGSFLPVRVTVAAASIPITFRQDSTQRFLSSSQKL